MSRNDSHSRPSRSRDMASLVFSFFLSIALLFVTLLVVVYVGVFSERGIVSVFDDTYFSLVHDYLDDQAYHYTIPTGIDPEVARDLFQVENVQYDIRQLMLSALRGTEYVPDTSAVDEELTKRVNDFFVDSGVTLSSETDEIASAYVGEIMDIYRDVIRIPGLDTLANARNRYMKYVLVAIVVVALVALVLSVTIMQLHHFPHRALRYLAYATGGAALMCFVVPCALYSSGYYLGLNLRPQYFYHLGTSFLAHVLKLCMFGSLVLLVATIALIILVASMKGTIGRSHSHHSRR